MKLLQKLLVVVILIQLLVVVQLYFIKSKKLDSYSSFLQNPLAILTKQESSSTNLLIASLKKQISQRKLYYNYSSIDRFLSFKNNGIQKSVQQKKSNSDIRRKIEQSAKRFLGYRYVWGATGPDKFDCSGFTQKVFKIVGINLPRVSREQAKVGKYVTFDALKKGDIVFFDTKRKRTGRVNHVGIYLEDGKFIHASSGGKRVMITSFKRRTFYKNRFLWGRRII